MTGVQTCALPISGLSGTGLSATGLSGTAKVILSASTDTRVRGLSGTGQSGTGQSETYAPRFWKYRAIQVHPFAPGALPNMCMHSAGAANATFVRKTYRITNEIQRIAPHVTGPSRLATVEACPVSLTPRLLRLRHDGCAHGD